MDPSNYSSTIQNMARLDVNMEYITEINARLREMKQVEEQMNTTRMQVLAQRQLEDADWYQRVQAHDAEEARLRNRKYQLVMATGGTRSAFQPSSESRNIKQADRFSGSPEAFSSSSALSSRRTSGRQGPRVGDPRFRLPSSFDAEGRPLWKRRSDGRHVYVMCPGKSCGKMDHKSIHGFLAHMRRAHPLESRLLGPGQMNAIEECAVLPERLRRFEAQNAGSDRTSGVVREETAERSVEDDDEELQIKEEPVEETVEGVDEGLDNYEDDAELRTKRWVETSSGSQAGINSDTVNEHGKRSRSVSSELEPFKRARPEMIFPKRIERRY